MRPSHTQRLQGSGIKDVGLGEADEDYSKKHDIDGRLCSYFREARLGCLKRLWASGPLQMERQMGGLEAASLKH